MSPRKISAAKTSADWHDFSVSSWVAGQTILHCAGSIRLPEPRSKSGDDYVTVKSIEGFDTWPTSW
ncbi:hypothetical protein BGW36DRAFT_387181 [Talaromyces proteolyticus]|uniref:Uncharacterized protein n=1 Tax=Talaromyces proteolyticus TaxID=1131652 RepID=A0AAD4PW87_9EURO|nr:uncharacterized protein BGW36DRAFT_387181 [Talaromyces proteolyticus]KAH8692203.1 hypothetical protein BGW36DRAFT_387181 [Talaromyces proteolyticus]